MRVNRHEPVIFPTPQDTMKIFHSAAKDGNVDSFRDTISLNTCDLGLMDVLSDMKSAKEMMKKIVDTDFHLGSIEDDEDEKYKGYHYIYNGQENSDPYWDWADIITFKNEMPQGWLIVDID